LDSPARSITTIAILFAANGALAQQPASSTATWQVCFAPSPDCSRLVVEQIARAAKTVRVQAYGFTDVAIAKALIEAKRRGVDVQVILDRSNRDRTKYTEATFFVHAEVPTLIDARHPIAHNKVIVIDGDVVITGSYNFTKHAQHNAENLLILRSVELARRYVENWTVHRAHSETLE
jgi:phosphatidylserine/phosphatidylglycerophosphate/cardiolipin synthase-like enzyme